MKYPKLWCGAAGNVAGGTGSPVGEGQVRALQGLDIPFAKDANPESYAYKADGFNKVIRKHNEIEIDGYLSLGDLGVPTTVRIMASPNARGVFTNRGLQSGVANFVTPQLIYIGRSWSIVRSALTPINYAAYYLTRDGKTFYESGYTHGPLDADPWGPLDGYLVWAVGGGLYSTPEQLAEAAATDPPSTPAQTGNWGASYLFDDGLPGPPVPRYAFKRGGTWIAGAVLSYPNTRVSAPKVFRSGPGKLLAFTVAYSNPVDPPGLGQPFFSYSEDAGETWTFTPSSAGAYSAVMGIRNDILAMPPGVEQDAMLVHWQDGMGYTGQLWVAAALNPTTMCGLMPMMSTSEWESPGPGLAYHAFSITNSLAQKHSATSLVYPDDEVVQCFHYQGAVYAQVIGPVSHSLWKTVDGSTWTLHTTLPFARNITGIISFDRPDAMLLPVNDGFYSLYESRDVGLTWTRRATINKDAPEPEESWPALRRFGVLNYIRNKGAPAEITPQAPWISNSARTYTAP